MNVLLTTHGEARPHIITNTYEGNNDKEVLLSWNRRGMARIRVGTRKNVVF